MARILGLDPGSKRIGVAMADTETRVATPFEVWDAHDWYDSLKSLLAEEEVTAIVVGHPRPLRSIETESSKRAVEFAQEVRQVAGVEVVLYDERFTTTVAERDLIGRGMKRRRRRQILDKLAATVMLQSYLDSQQ
jgi:putative Holliday junction resolvase